MIITLNYRTSLGLPSGVLLNPGVPTLVPLWESDKKSAVVRAWVKTGLLKEGDGLTSKFVSDQDAGTDAGDDGTGQGKFYGAEVDEVLTNDPRIPRSAPADEKAEILAALAAKGITADKRMGIVKLKTLLAES